MPLLSMPTLVINTVKKLL